ncbi:Transposable element Tcb1 transposase, partial [Stegodyphus mimosarum]
MRVWKQWTDECRTTRKSGSGPRNVTSARDDRHLVRMARTDRTASSRQLAALWSIATGVSLCASSIRRRLLQCGLRARTPLYRIPLTHDHRRLRLQWANQHRDWRADWQHVVFSDESRFNLWYHDGRIRVRRYAGERHLPECIIERHSGRTPGVMVWGAIAYHRRSQLLRIVGNLNSNRYIREVLQPEAVPFLQSLPGAVFQQDNARPHTARIVKSFFAAQQVQLLPWPACSPDMSPIEHVWDVIGRRLARDPRPVASADELWTNYFEQNTEFQTEFQRRLLQCGLRARTPLYRIPLTHDHRRLRLQWANQHRDWRADWQHVVFSDESRFNLWYHDGRIRVRRYAGERHLPECIIERHSGRTPGVMVWGAIAYHRRSQLLRIVGNLNSNRYIREVLQPEAVPFLQSLPGAVFQQDNARPHTARIVKSFFAAQQVQLLPWPACSPDMSPIEHVWDVIGRRLARDPRPVASADELWVRVQTIWNALPQSDIQTLFDSMPRRVAALIAARGGHTKY